MTATREAQQLIHAAMDVVAPMDRFSYLRGVIVGYKMAKAEAEGQSFQIQNKKPSESASEQDN